MSRMPRYLVRQLWTHLQLLWVISVLVFESRILTRRRGRPELWINHCTGTSYRLLQTAVTLDYPFQYGVRIEARSDSPAPQAFCFPDHRISSVSFIGTRCLVVIKITPMRYSVSVPRTRGFKRINGSGDGSLVRAPHLPSQAL